MRPSSVNGVLVETVPIFSETANAVRVRHPTVRRSCVGDVIGEKQPYRYIHDTRHIKEPRRDNLSGPGLIFFDLLNRHTERLG